MKKAALMILAGLGAAFLLSPFAVARSIDNYPGVTREIRSNGQYVIHVFKDGKWQTAGTLAFDRFYRHKEIELARYLSSEGEIKIRLVQSGGGAAHLDAVFLGELPPTQIKGKKNDLALRKVSRKDFDVIDASGKDMELSFSKNRKNTTLTLTARVEPERIAKTPFKFPLENLYRIINEKSDFFKYVLDSKKGSLTVDGNITDEGLREPFFKIFTRTGSGHPNGYTYGWIRNDDTNLYVAMDFVPDNTADGDVDYAKIYMKTSAGIKEFKVSAAEQRWGQSGFIYTNNAPYQHKVYEFVIPRAEIGIRPSETTKEVELAFAAYGTALPPPAQLFVDAVNGADNDYPTNGGSSVNAWKTLSYALDQISVHFEPGSNTLIMASGTYKRTNGETASNAAHTISRDDLTIEGAGAGVTIIDGTSGGAWTDGLYINADNVTIKNLSVGNFSSVGIRINHAGTATGNIVENCKIFDNSSTGIYIENGASNIIDACEVSGSNVGIQFATFSSNNQVRNDCKIYHNATSGIVVYGVGNEIHSNVGSIFDNGFFGGPGYGIFLGVSSSENNKIYGNKIYYSGDTDYPQGYGIYVSSVGPGNEIYKNEIHGHAGSGVGIYTIDSSPTIKQNEIYDNTLAGIKVESNGDEASPRIENNLIYKTSGGNMSHGILVVEDSGLATTLPEIFHNTIDGTTSSAVSIDYVDGTSEPIIKFNIISNSGGFGVENDTDNPGEPTVDWNDFWNNTSGPHDNVSSPGSNNIFLDPLFRAPYEENFRLQPISPAVDAIPTGDPPNDPVVVDWADAARPDGSGFDMGAFELQDSSFTGQNITTPPGTQISDYKIISVNVWPDSKGSNCVTALEGTYDPDNIKIGSYRPDLGAYKECSDNLEMKPGRGYWLLAKDGFTNSINGIPVSDGEDFESGLVYNSSTANGWNQIGPANAKNYKWADLQVKALDQDGNVVFGPEFISSLTDPNDYVDVRIWDWQGSIEDYVAHSPGDNFTLVAGAGYWVRAKTENVVLIFPHDKQLAARVNPGIMFASLLHKGKQWINKWILVPDEAVAASDDSPPRPMGGLGSSPGSSSGSGGCFIATAAFGSLLQPHVKVLRAFRDRFLLTSHWGTAFVRYYYTFSPAAAGFIARHDNLRTLVRLSLLPLVGVCWAAVHAGPAVALAWMLIPPVMMLAAVVFIGKRRSNS